MDDSTIRLLMVEDDIVDRMAFERLVKTDDLPYLYTCVNSVEDGKQALKSGTFDVVITDYRLGDGTAFDLIPQVDTDVPVILVTGAGGEEVAVRAMKSGASDYLMKDTDGSYLKTLPTTVEKALKAKRIEKELRLYRAQLESLVEERTVQLQTANEDLLREIEDRKRAEEALRVAHDELEDRVEQRTRELRRTNAQLVTEIADRQRAEEGLRKSKETVEAILNATSDAAFLLSTDGAFVALNQPAADAFGSTIEDLLGTCYFDLIPQDIAQTRKARFDEVVQTGTSVRFEDKGLDEIFDHSYRPVFNPDGSVERVAVFSRNVTEQKKAQELLVQKQRLAALGEMAGGVAHNFNNLLQIVIGAAGLAEVDLETGDLAEVKRTLSQIAESAQLGSETVKQLQDFARVRTADPAQDGRVFDFSETVKRAIDVSRSLWKSAAEKRGISLALKHILRQGCFVKGMQNELFEVVVNLLKNAIEAMPDGGKVYLKTYSNDGKVFLQVHDTGMGITKENLSKIFDPFWTTKGVQGTGMGLSTSFGIVSRHGGTIAVKSSVGKGTRFTVSLPLSARPSEKRTAEAMIKVDFNVNILIVDDQPQVVALLEKGLKRCGQTVFTADSGGKAIDTFKNNPVDVVVCDLGMPFINGWEVGRTIKEHCIAAGVPKARFILCTGWGGQLEEKDKIEECGIDRILEKPLKLTNLLEAIRRLLVQPDRVPPEQAGEIEPRQLGSSRV